MSTPNNPFKEIILPNTIPSAWPPAPIYWMILAIVIVIVCVAVFLIRKYQKKRKVIKQALTSLQILRLQKTTQFADLNQLMKAICLHYYPRQQVASLNGEAWFAFIEKHNQTPEQPIFGNQSDFCHRLYQGNSHCTKQDFKSVKKWIKQFPAQVKNTQKSTLKNDSLAGTKHV